MLVSQNDENSSISRHGERERRDEAAEDLVHQVSDAGAGEGVSLQPLSDEAASHWDRACSLSYGTSDKDLVPESAYEVEEGAQDGEHEHRAVPHVAVRAPLPVRAPPRPVRSLGHIGRVLARRARSTRCPVPRDVRRAELLKGFFLGPWIPRHVTRRLSLVAVVAGSKGGFTSTVGHVVRSADSAECADGLNCRQREGERVCPSFFRMSVTYLNYYTRSFSLADRKEDSIERQWRGGIEKNCFLPDNPFSLAFGLRTRKYCRYTTLKLKESQNFLHIQRRAPDLIDWTRSEGLSRT